MGSLFSAAPNSLLFPVYQSKQEGWVLPWSREAEGPGKLHSRTCLLGLCVDRHTGGQTADKLNPLLAFGTPVWSLRMAGTWVQVLVDCGVSQRSNPEGGGVTGPVCADGAQSLVAWALGTDHRGQLCLLHGGLPLPAMAFMLRRPQISPFPRLSLMKMHPSWKEKWLR